MKFLLDLVIVGLVTRAAFIWMQDHTTPHSAGDHQDPDQDTVRVWLHAGETILTKDEVRWAYEMSNKPND